MMKTAFKTESPVRLLPSALGVECSALNVSSAAARRAERGVALVITLILLSVTLIMAVAFLAGARRERNAVSTTTDAAIARLATDAALAAAEAQLAANLFATPGFSYNFGLFVSQNYIYLNSEPGYDPYNLSAVLPRPPVSVSINGTNDFRFYLDLNRNGNCDYGNDPEWIGVLERPDAAHASNNKFISRYAFLAQPVGNALDLNYIHNNAINKGVNSSSTTTTIDQYLRNQGVGSWELNLAAFLADLNNNQWNTPSAPYAYNRPSGSLNTGFAFQDAMALLSYRYGYSYGSLATAANSFNSANIGNYPYTIDLYSDGPLQTTVDTNAAAVPDKLNVSWAGADNTNRFFALPLELFDPTKTSTQFTNHLLSVGTGGSAYDTNTFYRLLSQLGSDSTADDGRMNLNYDNLDASGRVIPGAETNLMAWTPLRFFTNAANRLLTNATTTWLTVNSNSFVATFGVTNAFGLTSIPVYVNGQFVYTPAVNRLLQLAANIYDASTSSPYPSVFRPLFTRTGTNVFITSYTNVVSVSGVGDNAFLPPFDAATISVSGGINVLENVYGVPWIIGAKKGLPNFNQFSVLNTVQVTRKLQVTKPSFTAPLSQFQTNQMYFFSFTNLLGFSLWNSYTNAYGTNLIIGGSDQLTVLLTNDDSGFTSKTVNATYSINPPSIPTWPGTLWGGNPPAAQLDHSTNPFVSFSFTNAILPTAIYRYAGYYGSAFPFFDTTDSSYQTTFTASPWQNGLTPPLPHFGLLTTNRLQLFIINNNHVIDYVHFAGPQGYLDINTNLADPNSVNPGLGTGPSTGKGFTNPDGGGDSSVTPAYMWSTNYSSGTTPYGVINQINVSQGAALPPGEKWADAHAGNSDLPAGVPPTPALEQAYFQGFFDNKPSHPGSYIYNDTIYFNHSRTNQAPYTPSRIITQSFSWQANDPLVHYLASDLDYNSGPSVGVVSSANIPTLGPNFTSLNLTNLSVPYSPWGKDYFLFASPQNNGGKKNYLPAGIANWLPAIKDSLLWQSDYWDFPTNKYPTVGWLGRVHRGTPWQTVYLKASDILAINNGLSSWSQWTGNTNGFDATNSAPLVDEALFDLFSTAPNPNATRGTLSVNVNGGSSDPVPGLAAWSAVYSGLVVPTNTTGGYLIFPPAGGSGANSALGQIVTNLNATRARFVNVDGLVGVFEHVGSILRAKSLTEESPFLPWSDSAQQQSGISDALYEWLPQQTLGLLRVPTTPRYVIYCYGQALRPAAGGIDQISGKVVNYQIVAESAARALVHVNSTVVTNAGVVSTNYSTVIESYNLLPSN